MQRDRSALLVLFMLYAGFAGYLFDRSDHHFPTPSRLAAASQDLEAGFFLVSRSVDIPLRLPTQVPQAVKSRIAQQVCEIEKTKQVLEEQQQKLRQELDRVLRDEGPWRRSLERVLSRLL